MNISTPSTMASNAPNVPDPLDDQQSLHLSIISGSYSVDIYRLATAQTKEGDDDTSFRCKCNLSVLGKPYDARPITRLEHIDLQENEQLVAYALSLALRDTSLLCHMATLLGTTENNTPRANHAICILATAGFRQIMMDIVLEDEDGWDVYDMAAARACVFAAQHRLAHIRLQFGALICALIQIVVPVLLIYRGSTPPEDDLTWDVYIARLLFCLYAIAFEGKSWGVDNGDRVSAVVCYLPEFRSSQLIAGMLINKLSMVIVDVAIVILMLRSYTVFDVTLNALALYFILEVDDDLVDDEDMNSIRKYEEARLNAVQSEDVLEFTDERLNEDHNMMNNSIRAKYVPVVSDGASSLAIAILIVGAVWMIVEPFVLGWSVEEESL